MQISKCHNWLVTLMCAVMLCMIVPSASAEVLKIAIGEYPPYSNSALKGQGIVPRIIRAAFASQGYGVKFHFMPWGRSYLEAKEGNYDAAAYWFCTKQRRQDFFCSDPLHQETTYFFYNVTKPSQDWQQLTDLKNKVIGATRGYSYNDEFWRLARDNTLLVDSVTTDETNFKRLIKGNIDLFPMSLIPANYLLSTRFTKAQRAKLAYHPKPLLTEKSHLLFLKRIPRSQQLLATFNRGLGQIMESGEYQGIVSSYH